MAKTPAKSSPGTVGTKAGGVSPTYVSRKVLAEKLGISKRRVGMLIEQGKISELPPSERPSPTEGIDLDRALGEYQRNTDEGKRAAHRQRTGLRVVADNSGGAPVYDRSGQGVLDLNDAKRRKEHWNAERARLDVEVKSGNLIPREVVLAKQFDATRTLRDRLLSLPSRIVNWVMPDGMRQVEREIEDLIREMQDALSKV